ncbi:hypothetical protein AN958_02422 [Leucoagaricus sp. SymC.cos]|nr:hypothetical protein AN958_02422 [Leucoagaricus sp. SymC.cos]
MAYPPSSNYPLPQNPQYQQSLQSICQSDQYPQQDFTSQDTFSQQRLHSQSSFNQTHNGFQQNTFPQQLPSFPNQPDSFLPHSTLSQANTFPQSNQSFLQPSQPHLNQQPRQQLHSQTQYSQQPPPQYLSQQQQQQSHIPSLPQNQHSQSASPVHHPYPQQDPQSNTPSQPHQAQHGQQNPPVPPNRLSQHNQATHANTHSQQKSLAQPGHLSGSGARNHPNDFSQHTQFGQQQCFSQGQQNFISQSAHSQQPQGPSFSPLPNRPVQQTLPPHPPQMLAQPSQATRNQQSQSRRSSEDVAGTYQLFFTGRDDPRSCILIGEDTRPVYLTFETQENTGSSNSSLQIYRDTRDLCARLEWGTGGYLGNAVIGNRQFPMAQLVLPGSMNYSARRFASSDGGQFEWRRMREDTTTYDLYMAPNVRIALFRKYSQLTAIGPSHGLIQYTFSNDELLIEALLSLLLNRWIDMNGIQFTS